MTDSTAAADNPSHLPMTGSIPASHSPSHDPTRPNRVAWFNCQAGVAGDMTVAALIDAGADRDAVADAIAGLGVDGYALTFERVQRCGVGATWANVVVHDATHHDHGHDHDDHDHRRDHGHDHGHGHQTAAARDAHGHSHGAGHDTADGRASDAETGDAHRRHQGAGDPDTSPVGDESVPHRPVREILDLLDRAELPDRVRTRSRAVFVRLAEVEGAIHGQEPMDVELHEVGALDSIIDVVGACAALESLGIDELWCSAVAVGTGTIRSAHGRIPNPAPATVALLVGRNVPTVGLDTTLEVATPTGAALMTALAMGFGPPPAMTTSAVGYGAGTADPTDRANVLQVLVGERTVAATGDGTPVSLLECNVDDVTGEVLAHTLAALLAAGAHDAWITPIVMKKGRPAHTVSVLCDPSGTDRMRTLLLHETGTLGVRGSTMQRWPQQRTMSTVDISGHAVGVKVTANRVKVEFDDAATAAHALGLPVREVIDRATAAWLSPPDRPFS